MTSTNKRDGGEVERCVTHHDACACRQANVERALAESRAECERLRARNAECEIAVAQAVEFAQYVEDAAKGKMVERAKHFLSLPYSRELAERLRDRPG